MYFKKVDLNLKPFKNRISPSLQGKLGWLLGAIGREGVGQLCFLTRWLQPKSKGSHGERDPHANARDLAAHWSCESLALICSVKGWQIMTIQIRSLCPMKCLNIY